jgi:hypothetical protein
LRLISAVLVIGLGAGFGMAYLFFHVRPTFMTTQQLRDVTGLPVLGSITMQVIGEPNNKKSIILFASAMVGLVSVFFALMIFEYLRIHELNPFIF